MIINVYQSGLSLFDGWGWPIALPSCVAFLSLLTIFKIKWANPLSFIFALSFYAIMAYAVIIVSSKEMEQGRLGGVLPFLFIMFTLGALNLWALYSFFRAKYDKGCMATNINKVLKN